MDLNNFLALPGIKQNLKPAGKTAPGLTYRIYPVEQVTVKVCGYSRWEV